MDDAGAFLQPSTPRNAARGGTLGTAHTANWQVNGTAPAGGLGRLQLAAADVTRIDALSVTEAAAAMVIVLDGHPLPTPPPGGEMRLTPGQRADLALVMPSTGEVTVQPTLGGGKTHTLHRSLADLAPLPPNPVDEPVLATAEVIAFTLGWTPEVRPGVDGPCGDAPYAFWLINRPVWRSDSLDPGAPIATLNLGQSYIFRLRNETPNTHTLHLHGHAFRVRGGSSGFTNTVILDAPPPPRSPSSPTTPAIGSCIATSFSVRKPA